MSNQRLHWSLSRTIALCAGGGWLIIPLAVLLSAAPAVYAQAAPARVACDGNGEGTTPAQTPENRAGLDEQPCAAVAAERAEETPDGGASEQSPAQPPAGENPKAGKKDKAKDKSASQPSDKKGSWLFAPIPISSPAIGSGLEYAVAR